MSADRHSGKGRAFCQIPLHPPNNRKASHEIRPLHDRVLVRRVEAEEKTAGGIIIPDSAKEKPQEGEVVSVGEGAIMKMVIALSPTSKMATRSCSANGRAPKSRSTAKTC